MGKKFTHTDKPTDIVARGEGGFWKHLIFEERISAKMVDNLINMLLNRYPDRIATIEVRHFGTLTELVKTKL
jgi:hypothetical protein